MQDTPKSPNIPARAKKHYSNRRINPELLAGSGLLFNQDLAVESQTFLLWRVASGPLDPTFYSAVLLCSLKNMQFVNLHTNRYKATFPLPCSPPDPPTAWEIFQEFSHYTVGKSCRAARSGHCLWRKEEAYSLTNRYQLRVE